MSKTLEDFRAFASGSVINILYVPSSLVMSDSPVREFAFYFLGEEYLGIVDDLDTNSFSAFRAFGLEEVEHFLQTGGDQSSYPLGTVFGQMIEAAYAGEGFTNIIKMLEDSSEHIVVVQQ